MTLSDEQFDNWMTTVFGEPDRTDKIGPVIRGYMRAAANWAYQQGCLDEGEMRLEQLRRLSPLLEDKDL